MANGLTSTLEAGGYGADIKPQGYRCASITIQLDLDGAYLYLVDSASALLLDSDCRYLMAVEDEYEQI